MKGKSRGKGGEAEEVMELRGKGEWKREGKVERGREGKRRKKGEGKREEKLER